MTSAPRPPVIRPRAFSVEPYRIAVNEAASRVRGLWLGYLALTAYLTLAVIGVTHKDLFLETPISLPVMNVDLPLQAFFVVAPLFFLINHFYLLQQLRALGHRVHAFNWAMNQMALDAVTSRRERLGLTTYALVLLIGAAPEENKGWGGAFLWLVTVITLLLAPIILLLVFQLQFLAYHSAPITWVHRTLLLVDLFLLCVFWPAIRWDCWPTGRTWLKSLSLFYAPIAAFSLFLATFPGEGMDHALRSRDWVKDDDSDFAVVKAVLFGGNVTVGEDGVGRFLHTVGMGDLVRGPTLMVLDGEFVSLDHVVNSYRFERILPIWRVLHLAGSRDLIDLDRLETYRERREKAVVGEEDAAIPNRPLSRPGRDFRGADFTGTDLRVC